MILIPNLPTKKRLQNIAVLTSGGDAPGMNAAIRSVVRYSLAQRVKVQGILKGYQGLLEGSFIPLDHSSVANCIQRGGTILKTDRCPAFHKKATRKEAAHLLRRNEIDALIVIGGDGSFAGAHLLSLENNFPVIGVPGTIDNDIPHTDMTIGFDTAVNTALDAIDRIRDTASSHDRLFLVEVMGRSSGHIALQVGVGGGAETIVIPEIKTTLVDICRKIDRGVRRGKTSSIVVVAEGPKPGKTQDLAMKLDKLGYGARVCVLGHTQRGGRPTADDRFLGSAMGAAAVSYLLAGKKNGMVALQKDELKLVSFTKVYGKKKSIPQGFLKLADILSR